MKEKKHDGDLDLMGFLRQIGWIKTLERILIVGQI